MMRMRSKLLIETLLFLFLFSLCVGCRTTEDPSNSDSTITIQGESLVLVSTLPGKLCFDSIYDESVIVRSSTGCQPAGLAGTTVSRPGLAAGAGPA